MTPKKSSRKPLKLVMASLSLVLVLLATGAAMFYVYNMTGGREAFFARSINDASYDCEKKIVSKYDDKLVSKSFDNLSSRFDHKKKQYLIYYRISVRETHDDYSNVKDYLAKCIVWERLGYVSSFRILEY